MEASILEKTRKLNWVLQESTSGMFSYKDLCKVISGVIDVDIYLLDEAGKILAIFYLDEFDYKARASSKAEDALSSGYNNKLLEIIETASNIRPEEAKKVFNYENKDDKLHMVVPILFSGERLGTVILAKKEPAFTEQDVLLAEYGATVLGLEIKRRQNLEDQESERMRADVLKAIRALSYTEFEAAQVVFKQISGNEELVVLSKIADKYGLTRSATINALRRLEGAGLIETRSLGMKGTHIKILNDMFIMELKKTKF